MSEKYPRIEDSQFVWKCDNGHVTDTPIIGLISSVKSNEKTVCICHHPNCDRIFEVSDEFEDLLTEAADKMGLR